MTDQATNPVEDTEVVADEPRAQRYEIPDDAMEADEASPEPEEEAEVPPDDDVEVEHEGKKLRVPKEFKDAFLRQADYTRKTQEVSEQRRQLEAVAKNIAMRDENFQAEVASQRENIEKVATVQLINAQLANFPNTPDGWAQLEQQDPVRAGIMFRQRQQLLESRGALVQEINQHQQQQAERQRQAQAQQAQAFEQTRREAAQKCISVLSDPKTGIPNFSREVVQDIEIFAAKQLGFAPEEIANVVDPRIWKLVHTAMKAVKVAEKQVSAATAKPAAPTKPIASVARGSGARGGQNPDDLSEVDWMKMRDKQVNANNQRRR